MSNKSPQDLPFTCNNCGDKFGFGDGALLMAVVRCVPFHNEPTPCCGHKISGVLIRNDVGDIEMQLQPA